MTIYNSLCRSPGVRRSTAKAGPPQIIALKHKIAFFQPALCIGGVSIYFQDYFDGHSTHRLALATMSYNADRERVEQVTQGGTKRYIIGQGQVLSEYDGSGNWKFNYIYANGRRIARQAPYYWDDRWFHNDMLGSARVLPEESEYPIWKRHHYPFGQAPSPAVGEDRAATGSANEYKFAGKEDDGHGLYNSGARYYDPQLGAVPRLWRASTQLDPLSASGNQVARRTLRLLKGP